LYRLAGVVTEDRETRSIVADPSQFPYTPIVERIFGSKEVQKKFGFSVDPGTGHLVLPFQEDAFKKAYAEILRRTQVKGEGRFDSRTLAKNPDTIKALDPIFSGTSKTQNTWSSDKIVSQPRSIQSTKSIKEKPKRLKPVT